MSSTPDAATGNMYTSETYVFPEAYCGWLADGRAVLVLVMPLSNKRQFISVGPAPKGPIFVNHKEGTASFLAASDGVTPCGIRCPPMSEIIESLKSFRLYPA